VVRHNAAKFVPRLMSSDQQEYRIAVCPELKEQAEDNLYFISNISLSGRLQLHRD
jgi:uncharacterized protein YukJ